MRVWGYIIDHRKAHSTAKRHYGIELFRGVESVVDGESD